MKGNERGQKINCSYVEKRGNAISDQYYGTGLLSKIYMMIRTFALMVEPEVASPVRSWAAAYCPMADNTWA